MIQASKKVAVLIPCFGDQMKPQIGFDTGLRARRIGIRRLLETGSTAALPAKPWGAQA